MQKKLKLYSIKMERYVSCTKSNMHSCIINRLLFRKRYTVFYTISIFNLNGKRTFHYYFCSSWNARHKIQFILLKDLFLINNHFVAIVDILPPIVE